MGEVGEQKLRLRPGDSVLAPSDVPHVWAYLGPQPRRMLFAFTPAARIESFFEETSKPDAKIGTSPSRSLHLPHTFPCLSYSFLMKPQDEPESAAMGTGTISPGRP